MLILFNDNIEFLKKSGIYSIINLQNNKQYIGSTQLFSIRFKRHFYRLKKGNHDNIYLQNAFNKYGSNNFEFKILELCDDYLNREQEILTNKIFCLSNYQDYYYNIAPNVINGMKGRKHSEKTKNLLKGRKGSLLGKKGEEHPAFGIKHSIEIKLKMSNAKKGKLNPNYMSEILAKNIETGQEIICFSAEELGDILFVNKKTILNRLNKDSKTYTETLVKNVWQISRVKP